MMWRLTDYSENIAVIKDNGDSILYSELKLETDKLASRIERKRCLVFNLCSNEPGSLLGYLGFVNNAIVPVMLDATLDKNLLAYLLHTYKPEYIWLPNYMTKEFSQYRPVYSSYGYTLIETGLDSGCQLNDELALLLTTSGSTGSPKLVRLSYKNIRSNTESIAEYLGIDETERAITTLPMHYTYGISIINTHIYTGASIILTNKAVMQKEFWQQVKEYKATNFGGVPYTYEMLRRLRFLSMELPSLRYVTQAGGKLSPELCLEYAKGMKCKGKDFIVMYGATEATSRMSYVPRNRAVQKAGSIGIAIPGGRFELINVGGTPVDEPDTVGELVFYGDNVSLGYAECREDLGKADERHGRLETGDMAKRDEQGYYYIVGRKKRFLKLFGNRINLDEMEQLIKKQFLNVDCACSGIDDAMYVFVTSITDSADIEKYLMVTTGLHRTGFKVKCLDEIPKNTSGKTLYAELEKYYD